MNIPSTLEEGIEYGLNTVMSHRTFNIGAQIRYVKNGETIKIPMNHIVNKYREYFDEYIVTVELNQYDRMRYQFSPKVLSIDLYNTPEYWSILLYINECHSILDFQPGDRLRYVDPKYMTALVNEILIQEGIV